MIIISSSNNLSEVLNFDVCPKCNNNQKIIPEGDIKNHNAPIKKSLRSYKLFQWGNLVMHSYLELFHRSLQCTFLSISH